MFLGGIQFDRAPHILLKNVWKFAIFWLLQLNSLMCYAISRNIATVKNIFSTLKNVG